MKRLYLIRHGEAESFSRTGRDHGRALTDEGRRQARGLGALLADAGVRVVLASTAERAAATASGMGLDAEVRLDETLYNAGIPDLRAALAEHLTDDVETVALVAHAPGVPSLVSLLAGPDADPHAAAAVLHHFPTATVAGIEVTGSWVDLAGSRLFWAARG